MSWLVCIAIGTVTYLWTRYSYHISVTKSKEKDGETKGNTEFIGVKVARDFGKQGIFVGEIVALEYDSGDEAKDDPFYVVKYTDGDQEDLDGKELSRALELYHKTQNQKGTKLVMDVVDTDDEAHEEDDSMCSGSDDEETYVPSPEVRISNGPSPFLSSCLTPYFAHD